MANRVHSILHSLFGRDKVVPDHPLAVIVILYLNAIVLHID